MQDGKFTQLHDKMLTCQLVSMCPTMDLVGIVQTNGQLSVYRTMAWQRVMAVPAEDLDNRTVSCVHWSPDGKLLAVGQSSGAVKLLLAETGIEESYRPSTFHNSTIAAITWVAQQPRGGNDVADVEAEELAELAAAHLDRTNHFFGDLAAVLQQGAGATGRAAPPVPAVLQTGDHSLEVLVAADDDGLISLWLFGAVQLMTIDLRALLGIGAETPPPRPLQACLSGDLTLLSAVVNRQGELELIQVALPDLWRHRHHLKTLAAQAVAVSALLDHMEAGLKQAAKMWQEVVRVLEVKLTALCKLLKDYAHQEGCTPRDEFVNLLMFGVPSAALVQFFSHYLNETQLLRMQKATDGSAAQVEALLRDRMCFPARVLLMRAGTLQQLALDTGTGPGPLGVPPGETSRLRGGCQDLCIKAEDALKEVVTARSRLSMLLRWLGSAVPQPPSDPGSGNARPHPSLELMRGVLEFLQTPLREEPGGAGSEAHRSGAPPAGTPREAAVEHLLGTRVASFLQREHPLLQLKAVTCKAGPQGPFGKTPPNFPPVHSIVGGPGPHAHRTVLQQLDILRVAADAVFEAPRQRLTALAHPHTCCRLGSAEGASRTQAVLYSAGELDCGGQTRRNVTVVAAASAGPAAAVRMYCLELKWPASPAAAGGPQALPHICGHSAAWALPPDHSLQGLAFYGGVPGAPNPNSQQLALLLHPNETAARPLLADESQEAPGDVLALLPLANLELKALTPMNMREGPQAEGLPPTPTLGADDQAVEEWKDDWPRHRTLPSHLLDPMLAVSGARGTACVWAPGGRALVLDMEDDPEKLDDEDELASNGEADTDPALGGKEHTTFEG